MVREYQLMSPQGMIDQFHAAFGCEDNKDFPLRLRLIGEEFDEVHEAVTDLYAAETPEQQRVAREHLLKELCDLVYVTIGAASNFGMSFDEAFRRVHESNMSKLGTDGKPIRRADGKVVKGPNYVEPNLGGLV